MYLKRLSAGLLRHSKALTGLAARAGGVALGFIVTVTIGRWYGPAANGQYALVTQTAMFLSVMAVGGLDLAVTREFSRGAASGLRVQRQSLALVYLQAFLIAAAISGALFLAGNSLLDQLGRQAVPQTALATLVAILMARTFTRIAAAVLRSQRRYIFAQVVEVILIPAFTLLVLAAGIVRTLPEILWMTAAAGLVAALIGAATSFGNTSSDQSAVRIPMKTLWATALPLWGVAIAQNFAEWFGLATAGAATGLYGAGLYRVASQVSSVLGIVTLGLFGTFVAQMSEAHHNHDRQRIAQLAGAATRLSVVIIIPFAAALAAAAGPLLSLVGAEFVAARPLLLVLIIGQVVYAATGPSGLVLAITGHARINLAITISTTMAMLGLAPLAAREFGVIGVATTLSALLVVRNIASLYAVRHLEGIMVLTGRYAARQ